MSINPARDRTEMPRKMFVCENCGFTGNSDSFLSCPLRFCASHKPYEGQAYGYKMPYPKRADQPSDEYNPEMVAKIKKAASGEFLGPFTSEEFDQYLHKDQPSDESRALALRIYNQQIQMLKNKSHAMAHAIWDEEADIVRSALTAQKPAAAVDIAALKQEFVCKMEKLKWWQSTSYNFKARRYFVDGACGAVDYLAAQGYLKQPKTMHIEETCIENAENLTDGDPNVKSVNMTQSSGAVAWQVIYWDGSKSKCVYSDEKDAQHCADMLDGTIKPLYSAPVADKADALDPDMPTQELLLHMGELSANEIRVARAAIRWANGVK